MKKTLLVARYEYWRFARRKGYLFVVFGLPFLFVAFFGIIILVIGRQENRPVGAVDQAGILMSPEAYAEIDDEPPFVPYDSEEAARAALEAEEIQAYFVVPAGYVDTGDIALYHAGDPADGLNGDIYDYLRASVLSGTGAEADVAGRLAIGQADTRFISLTDNQEQNEIASFLFPFFFGLLLMMAIFTTTGYMLQAVVDEKENRTMEILLTSLSPEQLMTGKMAGLISLGLTQVVVWTAFFVVGFLIARANIPELSEIVPSWRLVGIGVAWFIPYYIIFAAIMAIIGLSVTEVSEGQQASGIFTLLAAIPFWFIFILFSAPDSAAAIALSLFPFTSPFSILVRQSFTAIPLWQYAVSWLLLAGTAVFSVFLVGRVMRLGMLRYGQRLTVRQMISGMRSS